MLICFVNKNMQIFSNLQRFGNSFANKNLNDMSNERCNNPIVVTICRDMFRYDSNEIMPTEGDNNGDNHNRHPNCPED